MESNIIASRPNPSSASNRQSAERTAENSFSYDDIFATASNSKVYFLELAKKAQAAEDNHAKTMKQWQEVKSRSQMENYEKSENALSQSTSSYNSIKNISSENSAQKINDECDEPREMEDKATDDTQLQVVLTPQTPKDEEDEDEEDEVEQSVEVVPIRAKNSLSSVKTMSKKSRKTKLKKKAQVVKMNDEQVKTSLIYSAKAKRKKFHGRLKNSNSKSTIATRDTNFSDKKVDRKKFRRQKSLDTLSVFQSPQIRKRTSTLKARESKQLDSKADFIEIFHTKAMKSVGNGVSSRLSKDIARTVAEAKKRKIQPVIEKNNSIDVEPQIHLHDPFVQENEDKSNNEQYQVHHHEQPVKEYTSEVYDPFYPRNYEMPTMASKMKRVHKPYYHHFNIKNIPFVVGTSLSPSHNLGLNIQQVLSIIKIKQPAVPGISPLLIRKLSRGVRPASTLFEHINTQYARSYRNLSRRQSKSQQRIGSFSCEQLMRASSSLGGNQVSFKQPNIMCEPLYEEDEDNQSTCSDSRARNSQQERCNRARKQQQHQHHHCQHLCENASNFGARATNNKEITEVFSRLYDQFDKMVSQHERLKEQLEKRKDKALLKEVSELETAMTTKEQEITAVVNLYNEVTSLKKQMKLLHERNSFVCIAAPDPSFQTIPTNIRARTAPGPFLDAKPSRREMPNALKLVGLLRQMQAFQRQLALA